jgi:Coenzyme PQQ synthesis protein D (PqqD)
MVVTQYPRWRADVPSRVVDGETVVLDRQHEVIHHLNLTATYIWERCDGQATVEDLAAQLTETFDVAYEIALKDVVEVIRHLQDLQLLEMLPDQPMYSPPQPQEALYVRPGHDRLGEAGKPPRSD